jgi:beta-fructofuranosidase
MEQTIKEHTQHARLLREKLLADPYRPRYHFVTPEGSYRPFDPNAAIFWKGRYHLMYIIQTEKGHCWAHISSLDLVHWRHHPLALEPGGIDIGIFSGGIFVDREGTPTITYWGLGESAGVCLATSHDDDLEVWTKIPENPVIHQSSLGIALTADGEPYGAADPSAIWQHKGRYYMLTGNLLVMREYGWKQGIEAYKTGDTLYLLVSDDLIHWEYLHEFYQSTRTWTRDDEDNMCPDFFPLGDRHMLLFISHNIGCQYYIGRYADDRFTPETHGRMTWVDNAYFAPESLLDDQGRRIMWAWIRDGRSPEACAASGWSGTMSLPRLLWLGEDKSLRMAPVPELDGLRYRPQSVAAQEVGADAEVVLEGIAGNSLELNLEMESAEAHAFGLKVCCSPDGAEQTTIYYDALEQMIKIDTTYSSLGEGPKVVEAAPFTLAPGERLKLRVYLDTSLIELFANDRQAVTRQIYPTRTDSTQIRLFSQGGLTHVGPVQSWHISPTNPH